MTPMRSNRRGMTLIEIMIALVLLGIVSGVIMRVVTRQQRFYQGVNQIMTQRGQLRQGTSVLPVDLRSLSSVGQDLIAVSDSAVEFDMNVGTGVVCAVTTSGTKLVLPPLSLASGATLTTFFGSTLTGMVGKGLTAYAYNDSSSAGNVDDRWQKFRVTAIDSSTSECITPASFASVSDAGKYRYILTVADSLNVLDTGPGGTGGPISRFINPGAPVRLMKRVKYKLFLHSDGKWYLGFAEYDRMHGAYEDLVPVSGPYEAYATGSGAASGFAFTYYDVDGAEISSGANATDRARISRVDVVARARTSSNVRAAGIQGGVNQQYKDSLAVSVMLRNRQ